MKEYKANLSNQEKLLGYIRYLRYTLRLILKCSTKYSNGRSVAMSMLQKRYPIKVMLRDGTDITLYNRSSMAIFAEIQDNEGIQYNIANHTWTLSIPKVGTDNVTKIMMEGDINDGDVVGIYQYGIYRNLPVSEKIVIDIGANIGDSPIYFALCGACRVIAVEPYLKNYETAKQNIELNNLSGVITLMLAACTIKNGYTNIDAYYHGVGSCVLDDGSMDESKADERIPSITLEKILEENCWLSKEFVLKMDCEGCEHDVILSATKKILRQFSHMQIEYHYGYRSLKEKLEDCGFDVVVTRPTAGYREEVVGAITHRWIYFGYIYAERRTLPNTSNYV